MTNMEINIGYDLWLAGYGERHFHCWNPLQAPHMLTVGATGSGKSNLNQFILSQIPQFDPLAKAVILDYKGDDYVFARGTSGLFEYESALEGLKEFHTEFDARRKGGDIDRSFRLLVVEELGALLAGVDKKEADMVRNTLGQLFLMGRSFNIHVLVSTQRPDASHFANGVRDSIEAVVALGNLSKEGKAMLFSEFNDRIEPVYGIGKGYFKCFSELYAVSVPALENRKTVESNILKLL